MRQRKLQLFHGVHDDRFELPGRRIKDRSHGDTGELLCYRHTDIPQNDKGRLMAFHCRKSSEPHLSEIARKSNQCQKRQLAESIVFVADHNDPAGHRDIGDHAAKRPQNRKYDRADQFPFARLRKIHQNRHRRVFFSRHHSSPRKSLTIFSFCPPERSSTISPS